MTKLVLISDTHGKHRQFDVPDGDILIHAGDIMTSGWDVSEVIDFDVWLGSLPHPFKIVIAGNHDWIFEKYYATRQHITNALYLEDSGIEMMGLKFWGSPVQPEFNNWAFNRKRGEDIQKHWDKIPDDTDVLITHGPPSGILDWTKPGRESLGCRNLRKTIDQIKPKLHVFGHIHGGYGVSRVEDTTFVNASLLDEAYRPANEPVVVELSD